MAFDGQQVAFSVGGDSHFSQRLENSLPSVALLAREAFESKNMACSGAEGREDGDNREQVRTVVEISVEGSEGCLLCGDDAAFVLLGEAGSGIHQDVHY